MAAQHVPRPQTVGARAKLPADMPAAMPSATCFEEESPHSRVALEELVLRLQGLLGCEGARWGVWTAPSLQAAQAGQRGDVFQRGSAPLSTS